MWNCACLSLAASRFLASFYYLPNPLFKVDLVMHTGHVTIGLGVCIKSAQAKSVDVYIADNAHHMIA